MRIFEVAGEAILSGERIKLDHNELEILIARIKRDCSDSISAMKQTGNFLYRGWADWDRKPFAFIGKPRAQRSTATNPDVVDAINAEMASQGFKALRTNTLACSSDIEQAGNFGVPFYIFPVNGFDFHWSPVVKDFGTMTGAAAGIDYSVEQLLAHYHVWDLTELLAGVFRYNNQDFDQALKSGNEINILGTYYALRSDVFGFNELDDLFI